MSCVILKLKSSITPWNGISAVKENVFKENLKRKLIILLLRKDIKELYKNKKMSEFECENKITVVKNNIVNKWDGILPSITQFTVKKNISNITKEFHTELIKLVTNGHKDQHKYLSIIKYKIIVYGFAIIESINNIVKSKVSTVKTSTNTPLGQSSKTSTLHYFIQEDKDILNFIDNSQRCELILSDIRQLSMASFFFYENDTSINKLNDQQFSLQYRDNVIQAFIHYLKYDSLHSVPSIFKNKYIKPLKYKANMSLDQKIEILESDKSNYNINALDNLLKVVYSKNMFNISANDSVYDESSKFTMFLNLKLNDIDVGKIVHGTVIDVLHNISTTNINDFKLYIATVNEKMHEKILQDVSYLGSYNKKEFVKLSDDLKNMTFMPSWNIYREDKTLHMNTILNFVKNVIFKMCKIYPSFIINNVTEHMEIKNRWGLSEKHLDDLSNFKNKNMFKFLNKFHSDDDKYIFSGDLTELDDIIQLNDNISHSKTTDKYICESLLTYSWLSVFRVFIDSASNLDNDIYFQADKNFYKNRMIQLLTTFLEMETSNKSHLDISFLQVQDNSFKHRLVEKK